MCAVGPRAATCAIAHGIVRALLLYGLWCHTQTQWPGVEALQTICSNSLLYKEET